MINILIESDYIHCPICNSVKFELKNICSCNTHGEMEVLEKYYCIVCGEEIQLEERIEEERNKNINGR